MKLEIGKTRPEVFTEAWPGEYSFFSHFEHAAIVPEALCMITTRKANGQPNAAFHSGMQFSGGAGGYYAILANQAQSSHTYHNILREKEFCINYLPARYYEACRQTIAENHEENDEIAAGGFTAAAGKTVAAPWIAESFLVWECKLTFTHDLTGDRQHVLMVGEVQMVAVEEEFLQAKNMCGTGGFMFNIPGAQNAGTGAREKTAMAVLDAEKLYEVNPLQNQ